MMDISLDGSYRCGIRKCWGWLAGILCVVWSMPGFPSFCKMYATEMAFLGDGKMQIYDLVG
jgi:hypothetical protein